MSSYGYSDVAGIGAEAVSTERWALWGPGTAYILQPIILDKNAVDATNTPTTELRHGLLLGPITASKKYKHYDPVAVDGSAVVHGFLWEPRRMLDAQGILVDRNAQLAVCGPVKAAYLIGLDVAAREDMYNRFIFDDDLPGNVPGAGTMMAADADRTLTAGDTTGLFTNRGATGPVAFTLPAATRGLRFRFFAEENHPLVVRAAAGETMALPGNPAAEAAQVMGGGSMEVFANDVGSKWLVFGQATAAGGGEGEGRGRGPSPRR